MIASFSYISYCSKIKPFLHISPPFFLLWSSKSCLKIFTLGELMFHWKAICVKTTEKWIIFFKSIKTILIIKITEYLKFELANHNKNVIYLCTKSTRQQYHNFKRKRNGKRELFSSYLAVTYLMKRKVKFTLKKGSLYHLKSKESHVFVTSMCTVW